MDLPGQVPRLLGGPSSVKVLGARIEQDARRLASSKKNKM